MSEGAHQGRRAGIPDDNERQAGIPADNEANPRNPDPNQNSPPIPNYDNPSPDSTTPEDANANPGLGSGKNTSSDHLKHGCKNEGSRHILFLAIGEIEVTKVSSAAGERSLIFLSF